jgi:hypothetical protein
MYTLVTLLCCAVLPTSSVMAEPIPAEFTNWFVGLTLPQQDTFTVILQGDQRANIPVQNALDGTTNPFFLFNPLQSTSVTVSLDSSKNTDIVYTGAAIPMSYVAPYPNGLPHVGLNNGIQPPGGLQVLSQAWSFSGGSPSKVPAPTLSSTAASGSGPFKFVIMFAQAGSLGEWFEAPYDPRKPLQVEVSNHSSDPFALSNAAFFHSAKQFSLKDLNYKVLPPPGQEGSKFTNLLPSFDGRILSPGQSVVASVPEPTTLVLFGLGIGLTCYATSRGGRDRKRRRRGRIAASATRGRGCSIY